MAIIRRSRASGEYREKSIHWFGETLARQPP
jgi:hypothetical protein